MYLVADIVHDGNGFEVCKIGDRGEDYDEGTTDAKVSKYPELYLDAMQISESNHKAIELTIMVESSTAVRNMDPMKKDACKQVFLNTYVGIIEKIFNNLYFLPSMRRGTLLYYKGTKKHGLVGFNLMRKSEGKMSSLRKFAYKFGGLDKGGSLVNLPSGSNQLKHMKAPFISQLWKKKTGRILS